MRAKTNTYIKTPARGEEPIFIITGRPEDVASARKEILSAAEHFTQIRARRASTHNAPVEGIGNVVNMDDNNRVTIMVRVPYRVIGLVVGPKGATVKRIQQLTSTYIVTPSRDKDPCFEVRGSPENVERARKEIESYIALRTGGSPDSPPEPEFFHQGSLGGPETYTNPSAMNLLNRRMSESSRMGINHSFIRPDERRMSPLSNAVFSGQEQDQFTNMPMSAPAIPSERVFDFSSFNDALMFVSPAPQPLVVNAARDVIKSQPPSPTYSWESNSSDSLAMNSPKQTSIPQALFRGVPNPSPTPSCCVCHDKEVVAALVPCGHNLFCMSCASYVAEYVRRCPVCQTQVNNILRIHTR